MKVHEQRQVWLHCRDALFITVDRCVSDLEWHPSVVERYWVRQLVVALRQASWDLDARHCAAQQV